ncbi:MAG: DNA repair protein RecO [Sandaracinus sp.]|nr:DNA repair protein RecO [Sandaracinus sp.]
MPELRDDAFLLRAVDFRDHDRVLTLLTREHGTLGVLARGARRSRKRFGGALEPFQRLAVTWRPGRGLGTLNEALVRRSHPGLLASLARMRLAGDGTAFVRQLCVEGQGDPEVFDALDVFLAAVAEVGVAHEEGLGLAFRVRVLALFGASPELELCGVSGEPCPPDRPAYFDPQRGTLVSRRHGGGPFLLSAGARARLRDAMQEGFEHVVFEASEVAEARPALDAFVVAHVGKRGD